MSNTTYPSETPIVEIIGEESENELKQEFSDLIHADNVTYDDVEDLLLGYGLEMDYLEQLLF